MQLLRYSLPLLLAVVGLSNCKDDNKDLPYKYQSEVLDLPLVAYNYSSPDLPKHMANERSLINQSVTDYGATLGRVLFYDVRLSKNNKVACASCHLQDKGFADGLQFSPGFDGVLTKRNASSIVNPVSSGSFFWDARESSLKTMVLKPIENHIEMGMDDFDVLEEKIANLDYYEPLFVDAFGDNKVNKERVAEALSQFLKSIVSGKSKFDDTDPNGWGVNNSLVLNEQENRGMNLFFGIARCANCHTTAGGFEPQGQSRMADIGLETNPIDKGLGATQPGMEGMFKVPSLRNVSLTGPYMHDGRFNTLEEVIDHYNEGIQPSKNLDWSLVGDNGPLRMGMTPDQKKDLIAFIGTFTDQNFLKDPKYSDPFKK